MLQFLSPIAIIAAIVALLMNGYGSDLVEQLRQFQEFNSVYEYILGTEEVVVLQDQVTPVQSDEFYVTGFWESYRGPLTPGEGNATVPSYYSKDIEYFDNLIYSFLTLDQYPNATHPRHRGWDGYCIYDATTQDCAENSFAWAEPKNKEHWLIVKNHALYRAIKDSGRLFILGIGGASDLTYGLTLEQVPDFASYVVYLLGIVGDGINLDFEHLSEHNREDQIKVMAHLLHHTRKALVDAHLEWKEIGYTARYNAFYNDTNRPANFTKFASDGELIDIQKVLMDDFGQKLDDVVGRYNVMFYDQPPKDFNAPATGPAFENFMQIINAASDLCDERKLHMGFEPGTQANGGVWEGLDVDKQVIDMLKQRNWQGAMFWTMNNPATGHGSAEVAKYAQDRP